MTLKDVASEAGVSITTVSRILNDRESRRADPPGDPATASSASPRDLGYRPNLLARGLRGSRSSLLGVIARDMSDPFHIQILRGINEVARQRDYRVFLGHVDYQPEAAIAYGSMFENSHADGIIVMGDIEAPARRPRLARREAPLRRRRHRPHRPSPDPRRLRRQRRRHASWRMDHLWGLGHRAIVCVSDNRTYDGRLRIDRYEHYMHEHGAGDRIQVFVTDQEPAPALRAGAADVRRLRPRQPADGDLRHVRHHRHRPDASGVPGRRGHPRRAVDRRLRRHRHAAFTIPPLTTISQDRRRDGPAPPHLLFTMIDENLNREEVSDVVLAPGSSYASRRPHRARPSLRRAVRGYDTVIAAGTMRALSRVLVSRAPPSSS